MARPTDAVIELDIYISDHCMSCDYAREVAAEIGRKFPEVEIHLIDIETAADPIPDAVFATPTYLLNGRVWSLGNPSAEKISQTLGPLTGRAFQGERPV